MSVDRRARTTRLWDVVRRQLRLGRHIVRTFAFLRNQRDWRKAFVRANRVEKEWRRAA